MAQLIFYDNQHLYEVDGVKMDSVSEILRFLSREEYGEINQYRLDNAASRGTAVHTACEVLYKYKTVECTPEIEPYVMAFLQFLKDHKCEFADIEKPLAEYGDREQDYGTPENNFSTIAELWQTYLKAKYGIEISLNAVDTAVMLSLLKISRIASGHAKSDNWVDLAGYAACGGEIESSIN